LVERRKSGVASVFDVPNGGGGFASSIFPLFPFSSYLFSSPLCLVVWGDDGATRVAAERMEAARATARGSYS
jgi:hypothetical protein